MTVLAAPVDDTAGWLARAASGDVDAFAQIVRRHHDDMVRVAYLVVRDADLADEAVQAAWGIAWRKLRSVRQPERLRSWLVSVAANEARALIRRRNRRSVVELAVSRGNESIDRAASEWASDLDLANAVARLDPEDRSLLAMRYVAGLSSFEIARATGRSASGIRTRLARLLARLREELSDA